MTRAARSGEMRIIGRESVIDGLQIEIELQVIAQPLPVTDGAGNARGDGLAVGLESNPTASEDVFPGVFMAIHFAPAEGLAGGECGGEVVIRHLKRDGGCGRHGLVGDQRIDRCAVHFFAAIEKAQLNQKPYLHNLRTDLFEQACSRRRCTAGGKEVIEQ